MDVGEVIGSAGSGRRELVLIGGGAVALGALFVIWRNRSAAASSVAADTGAAGYTYPMPGGALNTAPADNSTLTSLFSQNQEILRLLAPSQTDVGATTGTPDEAKPGPAPSVGDVPKFDPSSQPVTSSPAPMPDAPPASTPVPDWTYIGAVPTPISQVPSYPTVVQPAPSYAGAPVSADYYTASQPGAVLGMPSGAKPLLSYTEAQRQTLLSGGSVLGSKLVTGTNYAVPA